MKKLNYTQKMGLTASSAALFSPIVTHATPVYFDNSHAITVSYSGSVSAEWDVDGGGVNDFTLFTGTSLSTSYIYLDSNGGRNGRGLVKTGTDASTVNALNNGFVVGALLPTGYNWGSGGQSLRMLLSSSSSVGYDFKGAAMGSNFIGFRFDKDDNGSTYYGWAEIFLDRNAVTIKQWAYDDVEGAAVAVPNSAVPEPSGLALLAGGAMGLSAWRRRKHGKTV